MVARHTAEDGGHLTERWALKVGSPFEPGGVVRVGGTFFRAPHRPEMP